MEEKGKFCPDDCVFIETIHRIESDLKDIKRILNGNGKPGLVAKVDNHDKYITAVNKFQVDALTIFFRIFLTIILGYIAYKVGLQPPQGGDRYEHQWEKAIYRDGRSMSERTGEGNRKQPGR